MTNNMVNPGAGATVCVFNDPSIGDTFCSFSPDGMEGKIALYNAINNPEQRIANCINKRIVLRDVVVKAVKLAEEKGRQVGAFTEEGAERDGYRVILLDTDGVSYTATSNGIYNSVSTLRAIFGGLHFEDGLPVEVNQVKTKNGNTLTLKVVS